MTNMERLAETLQPQPQNLGAAVGRVTATSPLTVNVRGFRFVGTAVQCNAAIAPSSETPVAAGASVLCATLDGWQSVVVICEVT